MASHFSGYKSSIFPIIQSHFLILNFNVLSGAILQQLQSSIQTTPTSSTPRRTLHQAAPKMSSSFVLQLAILVLAIAVGYYAGMQKMHRKITGVKSNKDKSGKGGSSSKEKGSGHKHGSGSHHSHGHRHEHSHSRGDPPKPMTGAPKPTTGAVTAKQPVKK